MSIETISNLQAWVMSHDSVHFSWIGSDAEGSYIRIMDTEYEERVCRSEGEIREFLGY